MRLNDILTERQQNEMHMLQEGPLGSLVRAAGRGVGNVIGGVATGIGAVKGAVKGAVDRAKTSFAAGQKGAYDAVAGKSAAAGATGTTPAAGGTTPPAGAGAAGGTTSTPPAGAATPPAGAATPPAGAAPDEPKAAAEPQSDSEYDKAQKAIEALPPEQKKEIVGLLQADPKVKAAMVEPPPPKDEKPAGDAAKPGAAVDPAVPAAGDAAKPGAAPAVDPAAPAADATATPPVKGRGGRQAGAEPSQTPGAVRRRDSRKAATAQKQAAAAKFDTGVVKPLMTNSSRVNPGTALSEMLARRVAHHKRNIFESQLDSGTQSIFRQKK